jgi:hypothetical protein
MVQAINATSPSTVTSQEARGERAKALLARVTYKEGWRLGIQPSPAHGTERALYLTAEFTDSYRQDEVSCFGRCVPIPSGLEEDEDGFYRFVLQLILVQELHEAQEWFRVDGVPRFNPHLGEPLEAAVVARVLCDASFHLPSEV